jgi:hypothetical protein
MNKFKQLILSLLLVVFVATVSFGVIFSTAHTTSINKRTGKCIITCIEIANDSSSDCWVDIYDSTTRKMRVIADSNTTTVIDLSTVGGIYIGTNITLDFETETESVFATVFIKMP